MLGHVGPNELRLELVSRFPNGPVEIDGGLHWSVTGLYESVLAGLTEAATRAPNLASIGIDSWAVDYGLLSGGELLGEPFHYRDGRTERGVAAAHAKVPFEELYAQNGLQFLAFNSLYQFAADGDELNRADSALLIPDLLAYWLTGARVTESTNASTTGLLTVNGEWNDALMSRLGLPRALFAPLVSPGTTIGTLLPPLAELTGLSSRVPVTAVGSHDTASAVVGIPMTTGNAAYISCGTWGLVGLELDAPVLTNASREANFTNEGGVDGRVRFLHNVMGLWLLSESVRTWERESGTPIDLPALLSQAAAVTGPVPVFDANDARLMAPGDMPARIAELLRETNQSVPLSQAEFTRSIVESLADAFAHAVETASRLAGTTVSVIHIVGGGSLNTLLCQLTADRAELPVLAGPVEATAIGNVLVQARAVGLLDGDLESLRALVAASFEPVRFEPRSRS
ncbi:rhamnulokinase [Mycetocola zhadangensis]|uniref:Rhamnulokinase n=1 Tax=Mycetocola zhadangensis TaxID=1164595 RepID=A0A3L7J2B4_9MICO|nr:rhamnulokinase family protein [Mycetocola zhadangensis]RLQ84620.1 rhamnulokinase [Mycetocola zhadangensis]